MTAAANERMTDFAGLVPARGNLKIAANTLIKKGWLVGVDAAGRAVPGDTVAAGCLAGFGKASSTIDNRTGSELGGAADATDVFVEYGIFGWQSAGGGDTITAADVGKVCWVVDNQTVGLTSGGDTRALAGYISEVRNGFVYVQMGPTIVGQIVIAAAEASELDTAQADITEQEADLGELTVNATTAQYQINIPLMSALSLASGAALAAFADAEGTVPGTEISNSKCASIRWNDHATPAAIVLTVPMPQDLDDAQNVVFHALVSKVGATLGDATKLTVGAFEQTVGALNDADVDFGGDTTAVVGDAASKTVTEITLALGLADVHPTPSAITLTIKPKAGTLGTDDFCLHAAWFEVTRKILTS